MGNIVTGSGSGEPSPPSVLSHEGVQSEKDRLTTRSLNTSQGCHVVPSCRSERKNMVIS